MHFMWNRKVPKLDLVLWIYWDVHVLLRSLADLCIRDASLWAVSTLTYPKRSFPLHFPTSNARLTEHLN